MASIVHYRIGKTPARGDTAYWEPGTIPWVSISDMKDYGTVDHTKEYVSPKATTLLGKTFPAFFRKIILKPVKVGAFIFFGYE